MKLSDYPLELIIYQAYSALNHIMYDIIDDNDIPEIYEDTAKDFFIRTFKILDYLNINHVNINGITFNNAIMYNKEIHKIYLELRNKYKDTIKMIERNNLPVEYIKTDLTGELGTKNLYFED